MHTQLGAFSNSLAVSDIKASRAFYEKLGFTTAGGDESQGWLILRRDSHTIGLFQGMFERNTMTFNPGWDAQAKPLKEFTDVRELQREFEAAGVLFALKTDGSESGPASFVVVDPDGNPLLFDQHI